jgi:hypothetical protein
MERTYGLWRYVRNSDMKTLRIVNTRNECVYVERLFFRRWWLRVTPRYRTNIEAYNWVRRQGNVELVKKR